MAERELPLFIANPCCYWFFCFIKCFQGSKRGS